MVIPFAATAVEIAKMASNEGLRDLFIYNGFRAGSAGEFADYCAGRETLELRGPSKPPMHEWLERLLKALDG
jgi:hypothetical protein